MVNELPPGLASKWPFWTSIVGGLLTSRPTVRQVVKVATTNQHGVLQLAFSSLSSPHLRNDARG
jgi:hypothetical protein